MIVIDGQCFVSSSYNRDNYNYENDRQGQPTTFGNVSKYSRNASDCFLCALEACLDSLELP